MVSARALPLMGGIETHVHEVARRLAASGVDVTVLTTDTSGDLPADEIHVRLPDSAVAVLSPLPGLLLLSGVGPPSSAGASTTTTPSTSRACMRWWHRWLWRQPGVPASRPF